MSMIKVVAVALIGVASASQVAVAGALDRGPMQQRYNPAAENMMRVPGVVGVYEQDALSMLQQAGLAVTVKRITKDNPKYRGKEGQVVSQVPAAGGVAMVGSTVVITVYKRGQGYQDSGYGDQWGGGDDTGGWTPPPPDEGYEDGYEESPPSDQHGFEGDLGHDVPNVPGPAEGISGGGSGGVVGRPAAPSVPGLQPVAPGKKSGKPVLTPEQMRGLQEKLDKARRGGGKSGKPGTIVAHPVNPAGTPVRAGGGKAIGSIGKDVPPKSEPRQGVPEAEKIGNGIHLGSSPASGGGSAAGNTPPPIVSSPVGRPATPTGGALGDIQKQTEKKVKEETEKPKKKSWLDRLLGK